MKAAVAALLLLASSTAALAETDYPDGPPGSVAPAILPASPIAPTQPAQPKRLGIDEAQLRAASNRGMIGATAITVPEGKVEVTFQAVVPFAGIASLNAGITRTTEMWVDGATTLMDEEEGSNEHAYGIGIKQVLVKNKNLALALTGSLRKTSSFGDGRGWKSIGAVGTLCMDDHCNVMASGGVQRLFGYHQSYDDIDGTSSSDTGETLITLGISAGNASTRFLIESVTLEGESLGFMGLRLGNRTGAVDFGLVRAMDGEGDVTIPWVGVTGRL